MTNVPTDAGMPAETAQGWPVGTRVHVYKYGGTVAETPQGVIEMGWLFIDFDNSEQLRFASPQPIKICDLIEGEPSTQAESPAPDLALRVAALEAENKKLREAAEAVVKYTVGTGRKAIDIVKDGNSWIAVRTNAHGDRIVYLCTDGEWYETDEGHGWTDPAEAVAAAREALATEPLTAA